MPERKIIDCHHHIGAEDDYADRLADQCAALGIARIVLLGMPEHRVPGTNERVLDAAGRFPDLIIPFAGVDMEHDRPETIRQYADSGFRGLKFIGPIRAYNHPAHVPLYQEAAELGLVGLFHLGIVANRGPWVNVDSNLMRPIHLDHIARQLPDWKIIGAHLGNPWYDEATMSCRWNANLFFDLSGSTLKKKSPEFLSRLLWWSEETYYKSPDLTSAWQKIVFGSDVVAEDIGDVLADYDRVADALEFSEQRRHEVFFANAARVLGIEDD